MWSRLQGRDFRILGLLAALAAGRLRPFSKCKAGALWRLGRENRERAEGDGYTGAEKK